MNEQDQQWVRDTLRQEFRELFSTMPDDQVEMLAEQFSEYQWNNIPTNALRKIKRGAPTRFLLAGADVNLDDAGAEVGFQGPTLPDIWNFDSGFSADLETGDGRQVNIQALGGGADCMFDYLVSTCWADKVNDGTGRFTEGQVHTSLTGCTFLV